MAFILTPYQPETNKFHGVFIGSDGWLYSDMKIIQSKMFGGASSSDVASTAHFEANPYKGVNYLKFSPWGNQGYADHYLSVDNNGFLGVYAWTGATGWRIDQDTHLVSVYNGQNVAISVSEDGRYKADNHWPGLRFPQENNGDLWAALGGAH